MVLALLAGCSDVLAPPGGAHSDDGLGYSVDDCELGGTVEEVRAELAALRVQVDALHSAGRLSNGQARALGNHLANAERQLGEGRLCPAEASLRAFQEQVGNFLADGVLTEAEGVPLLEGVARALGEAQPPVLVERTISAGRQHTCGLTSSGTAYCWGQNDFGQLGDGTTTSRLTPTPVAAPPGVSFDAVSAGFGHTCGLSRTGAAYCWGANYAGQLGDGTTDDRLTPSATAAPPGVSFAAISAGFQHTCALSSSGAYCWGSNYWGQLGDGTTGDGPTTDRLAPTSVAAPPGVSFVAISAGTMQTCGLSSTGGAYCWGENPSGQLGDGTDMQRLVPTPVAAPPGVSFVAISAGSGHTCGVSSSAAYCWGSNSDGQLGDGTTTRRLAPAAVAAPPGVSFVAIRAGGFHTCGTSSSGAAWCWGGNDDGQLGDGTTTNRLTPSAVAAPSGVRFAALAGGFAHNCGLSSTAVYCWGDNSAGQLGDNTTTDRLIPTAVAGWSSLP